MTNVAKMSVKWISKILPMMEWLPSYRKEWLRFDVAAGLTTAAVVIPQAMAYAAIAGLPLVVGLYTSLVMLVVYAAFGTSRLLSVTAGRLGRRLFGPEIARFRAACCMARTACKA